MAHVDVEKGRIHAPRELTQPVRLRSAAVRWRCPLVDGRFVSARKGK
jgi:hypothetical protein